MNKFFKSVFLVLALAGTQQTKTIDREKLNAAASYLGLVGILGGTLYNFAKPKSSHDIWLSNANMLAATAGILATGMVTGALFHEAITTNLRGQLSGKIADQKRKLNLITKKRQKAIDKSRDLEIQLAKIASELSFATGYQQGPFDIIKDYVLTGDEKCPGTLIDEYWCDRKLKELKELKQERNQEIARSCAAACVLGAVATPVVFTITTLLSLTTATVCKGANNIPSMVKNGTLIPSLHAAIPTMESVRSCLPTLRRG